MKTETTPELTEEILIAHFGDARLMRIEGRIELRGGTMSERAEALEWMAMFLPDEVLRVKK